MREIDRERESIRERKTDRGREERKRERIPWDGFRGGGGRRKVKSVHFHSIAEKRK